jgi:hypothetical protein
MLIPLKEGWVEACESFHSAEGVSPRIGPAGGRRDHQSGRANPFTLPEVITDERG